MSDTMDIKDKTLLDKWFQLASLAELLSGLMTAAQDGSIDKSVFEPVLNTPYFEMVKLQIGSVVAELTIVSQLVLQKGLNTLLDEQDNELILDLLNNKDNNSVIEQQEQVLTPNTRIH